MQRCVVEDDRGTVYEVRKSEFDVVRVRDLFNPRLRVAERSDVEDGDRWVSKPRASSTTCMP